MQDDRTRTVLDALPVAVLIADPGGRVGYANGAARALLGDLTASPGGDRDGGPSGAPTLAGRAVVRAIAEHAARGEPVLDLEVEVREAGGVQRLLRVDLHPGQAGVVAVVRRAPGAGVLGLLRRLVTAAGSDAERQARFLADVGRRLAASLDRETTLESIARAVVPTLADWAIVRVVEEGGHVRSLRWACADPVRQEAAARLQPYEAAGPAAGDDGLGRVLETGRPEAVAMVDEAWLVRHARDTTHLALLRELRIVSLMHVPLLGAGRPVGAITLARTEPNAPYTAADLALAEEVCDRAGVALENARLFAESETRRREAEAIAEIGRVLAATLDPRQVWQRIADSVRALLRDAPSSALYCFDPDTGAAAAMAVSSEPGLDFEWTRFLPAGHGLVGQVAAHRRTLAAPDILADPALAYPPDVRARLERSSFRAVLAVPLAVQERLLGALTVGGVRGRVFAPREIRLVETFANQAAVALDNARLYTEAEARRQEAETARASAEAANHAKDQFLAVLSHELRTPLTSILGWISLVRGGRLTPAEHGRALDVIERNARLQARLIDELLDVSRIAAGKLELDARPADLAAVVADIVESVRQEPNARAVLRAPEIAVDSAPVVGDAVRLAQVFTNLLANAVKFTPRGGRVDVRVVAEDGWVRVDVADTGQGIAPEELPHIFDRFRQVSTARPRGQQGLGLGLAIARRIVELHGGRIDVDSAGRGLGAVFTVRIPRAAEVARRSAAAAEADVSSPAALAGVRVLFVDDNADTRGLIGSILAGAGAEIRLSSCGRQALEVLASAEVDVLVSDIGMPDLDGYALVGAVRARERAGGRPQLPAIALTAYATVEDRARAVAAGFQRHIAKPLEPSALIDAIREVVARR